MQKLNENTKRPLELSGKYGPLLTTIQVAEIFHRSAQSLRVDLSGKNHSDFAESLIRARKYIGRRVYFKVEDIEKIIEEL